MVADINDIVKEFEQKHNFALLLVDAAGSVQAGELKVTDCECQGLSDERRIEAAEQTRYWGEPVINLCCDTGYAMWGVPWLDNNQLRGALIVQGVDLEDRPQVYHKGIQNAAQALLDLALHHNLMNRAELELAKQRALQERDRFLAIEASKWDLVSDDLRSLYLREEPALLGAIKGGAILEARSILNRVLTGIYGLAGDRLELLKSCILELVVMMSRAAVEAGADPASMLGRNYRSLTELAAIDDEEELSEWVRRMLEALISGIRHNNAFPHSLLLQKAVRHMQENLHQHLRRDEVARVAGLSPSHFSKLVTERMGRSYTQLLLQLRTERAKELLLQGQRSLADIAIECGFCDQSHFNKSFRSQTGQSPGDFRKHRK